MCLFILDAFICELIWVQMLTFSKMYLFMLAIKNKPFTNWILFYVKDVYIIHVK